MNSKFWIKLARLGSLDIGLRLLSCLMIASLILGSASPLSAKAAASAVAAQVSLSSAFIYGGGTLVVTGAGLLPITNYAVGLIENGRNTLRMGNQTVLSDSRGRLFARLNIVEGAPAEPAAAVGLGLAWDNIGATTPLEIRAAFSVTPTPASGKPGATVQLAISNLEAGTLRVDLDGQPVIGPLTVPAGAYLGSFVVPNHSTAAKLGVKLTATNNTGVGVIGQRSTIFDLLAPDALSTPQLSGLAISPNPLMPGEAFTLTGRVWPLPTQLTAFDTMSTSAASAVLQGMLSTSAVDKTSLAKSPVSTIVDSLDANGYFSAHGTAPAAQLGNAVFMKAQSQFEVKINGSYFASSSLVDVLGAMDFSLTIHAVDPNGAPLEVKTTLTNVPRLKSTPKPGATINDYNLQEMFCNKENYIHQTLPGTGLAEYLGSGEKIPVINPVNQLLIGSDLYGTAPEVVTVVSPGATGDPLPMSATYTGPGGSFNPYNFVDSEAVGWAKYHVIADGRGINYSYLVNGKNWQAGQKLRIVDEYVWFHMKTSGGYPYGIYNAVGSLLADGHTLTYTFEPVPGSAVGAMMGFDMEQAIKLGKVLINGKDLQVFGGFFHLEPIDGQDVNFSGFPTTMRFNFSWNSLMYGALKSDVGLFLDGVAIGIVQLPVGSGGTNLCTVSTDSQQKSVPRIATAQGGYQLEIPYLKKLTAGMHVLRFNFTTQQDLVIEREIALRSDELPAWFLQGQNFSSRAIYLDTSTNWVTFGGKSLDQNTAKYGAGDGEASGTVPNTGPDPIKNEVKNNSLVAQVYIPSNDLNTPNEFQSLTISMSSPTQAMSNKPSSPPSPEQNASDSVHIEVIDFPLAYIAMPLYVMAFADPFGGAIVNATTGALMTGFANLDIIGDISTSKTDLWLTPYAEINLRIFLNIQILYGVLGQAEMALMPSFGLNMSVHLQVPKPAGQSTPVSVEGVCFSFRGDVYFFFGFLCAPYLGCLVEHEGTKNIYTGTYPTTCKAGDKKGVSGLKPFGPFSPTEKTREIRVPQAIPPKPLSTQVNLFTTGKGNVAALIEADGGSMQISQFINGYWTTPSEIIKDRTNDSAIVAPLSANRNLMMWITSDSTSAELQATTIHAGAKSMYVKSQLADGNVPMQVVGSPVNVTMSGSGDGQIAISGCPEDQSGCPSGGKATAVWMRMKTADATMGGTQLNYATYNGTSQTWGPIAAITQPAAASDGQAQVVFNNAGMATIYFVRDVDGSMSTSGDRYLYQYTLGAAGPTQVAGIHDSIYEFSLAYSASGELNIAYTRVEGTDVGLIDSRHPLYVGQTTSGVFATLPLQVKDTHGRAIFAESPSLQFSGWGEALLTYRALGMGPDGAGLYEPYPGDSAGVIFRTGEMAQISVKSSQQLQFPKYLTLDGAVNWGIQSAKDLISGKIISAGVNTSAMALPKSLIDKTMARPMMDTLGAPLQVLAQPMVAAVDSGIVFAISSDQPQFAIQTVEAVNPDFQSAGGVFVNLGVSNQGAAFAGTGINAAQIVATWDAPYGEGTIAGQKALESLDAGGFGIFEIPIALPVSPDLAHTLYVTIAPPSNVQESTLADNTTTLKMGGIAAPKSVMASVQDLNTTTVHVTWQGVYDARVKGYRIYRAPVVGGVAGSYSLIGTTESLYWPDTYAVTGKSFRYAVTALGISGVESPLSQAAQANLPFVKNYVPRIMR